MFFDTVPGIVRPAVLAMVNRQVQRSHSGQGIGRHLPAEHQRLAERAAVAVALSRG